MRRLALVLALGAAATAHAGPRTVAHPVARRTYAIDRDAAREAEVVNRRFAAAQLDAAARVDHDRVIVELGAMDDEQMELAAQLAYAVGRFELRKVDDAALAPLVAHVAADRDAARRGIFVDHHALFAIVVPTGLRTDNGRKELAAYVAALPADLRPPAGDELACEWITFRGTYAADKGWRGYVLAGAAGAPGARLALRSQPTDADPDPAELELELDDWHRIALARDGGAYALVVDGEVLAVFPADDVADPLGFTVDDPDRAALLAAMLAGGPLPRAMRYETIERL